MTAIATVDEYIDSRPSEVQHILRQIRATILNLGPDLGEKISYQMPTVTLHGKNLVHYAAWKRHIGMYPLPAGDDHYQRAIAPYRSEKATLNFPLDQVIPYHLIAQTVELLIDQHT